MIKTITKTFYQLDNIPHVRNTPFSRVYYEQLWSDFISLDHMQGHVMDLLGSSKYAIDKYDYPHYEPSMIQTVKELKALNVYLENVLETIKKDL